MDWFEPSSPADVWARAPQLRCDAVEAFPDPRDRNTLGPLRADAVVALLAGNADAAIAKLSRAVEIAPHNAIVRSDLAAARLQRGVAFSDPYDFLLALAAANRAFHLDPGLPEVRFNLALALQKLSLYERARAEWRIYLDGERDPAWLRIARTHAAALERSMHPPTPKARRQELMQAVERGDQRRVQAIVASSPQSFRVSVEQELLPAWAEAEAGGRTAEARQLLAEAGAIGKALVGVNGERMAADTVAQILDLQKNSPLRLPRLVHAIQAYGHGLQLVGPDSLAAAVPVFQTASRLLSAEHSPLAGWAIYWIAYCRFQLVDPDGALALLRPLCADRNRDRYAALHGRSLALMALISIFQGDPTAALSAYKSALADHQKLGETAYAAKMVAMEASCREYLGQRREAWRELYPALIEPATFEVPEVRESILVVASWLAGKEGNWEIALWFHEEVVRNAMALGRPSGVVEALRGRSEILAALGRRDEAAADLEQARQQLQKVIDSRDREGLEGNLGLAEAHLADSPQEAIERLNGAIRIYRSFAYHYRLAQAFFLRARAYDALGRSDDAERDLTTAIGEFEQERKRINDSEERVSFFDRTREIFDAMVQFQVERRHRPRAAFGYSEQAKARVLLDWMLAQPGAQLLPASVPGTEPPAVNPGALARHLPPDTTVVEYWVLPQDLVIWVLRQDDFQMKTVKVDARTLEGLIYRLVHELQQRRRADFLKTSSKLYDLLISPVAELIPTGDRVVVVPDGALHGLPFAVLRNSGKYLSQNHVLAIVPSTNVLLASLRRDEELASQREPRALAFVDPAFDRELFPSLLRLGASQEKAIEEAFPGSHVLSGQAATRRAFLERAGEYEALHFGGHSLINSEYPLLSQMLFASEPGDRARGVLYSGDVLRQRFGRTRLVVLASCSTAAGKISRTEGVESLARPFMAAGVPAVVASLWKVDDKLTAEFFRRFYGHLRQELDPALALQQTQTESLTRGNSAISDPWAWGAFELIGDSAPR